MMPINKGNNKGHATRSLSSVTSRYIYVPLLCLHGKLMSVGSFTYDFNLCYYCIVDARRIIDIKINE